MSKSDKKISTHEGEVYWITPEHQNAITATLENILDKKTAKKEDKVTALSMLHIIDESPLIRNKDVSIKIMSSRKGLSNRFPLFVPYAARELILKNTEPGEEIHEILKERKYLFVIEREEHND